MVSPDQRGERRLVAGAQAADQGTFVGGCRTNPSLQGVRAASYGSGQRLRASRRGHPLRRALVPAAWRGPTSCGPGRGGRRYTRRPGSCRPGDQDRHAAAIPAATGVRRGAV